MRSRVILIVSVALVFGSVGARGSADGHEATVALLKRAYLDCERRALTEGLPTGEVVRCSEIYERLKLLAFGGNWMMLREWTELNLSPGQNT